MWKRFTSSRRPAVGPLLLAEREESLHFGAGNPPLFPAGVARLREDLPGLGVQLHSLFRRVVHHEEDDPTLLLPQSEMGHRANRPLRPESPAASDHHGFHRAIGRRRQEEGNDPLVHQGEDQLPGVGPPPGGAPASPRRIPSRSTTERSRISARRARDVSIARQAASSRKESMDTGTRIFIGFPLFRWRQNPPPPTTNDNFYRSAVRCGFS